MNKLFLTLGLLISSSYSFSAEFLVLDDSYLSVYKYYNYYNTYYMSATDEIPRYGVEMGMDTWLIKGKRGGIYLNPRFNFIGTDDQVRYGGLDYDFGIDTGRGLELFYHHSSHHMLDSESVWNYPYPLDDHVGIKIHFTERRRR